MTDKLLTRQEREELLRQRKVVDGYDFAPTGGYCYSCNGDLVEHYREQWKSKAITGCPFCQRSYCD